ncbi:MAG: adenylate/guanylate cyclase domain-containing protein [Spirochaetota bacterium]
MTATRPDVLDELVRASTLLSEETSFTRLASILVEQSLDITHSDLAALYLHTEPDGTGDLTLVYRRGQGSPPTRFAASSELAAFITETDESVVLLDRKPSPFLEILLRADARSGIALPVSTATRRLGVLVLNSVKPNYYNRKRFHFLDGFARLASGMLNNARMYKELQEHAREIEALHRYQESVFESMTNLLITIDETGRIHYFNRAAAERLGLHDDHLGSTFSEVFAGGFSRHVFDRLMEAVESSDRVFGLRGIYRTPQDDMDFELTVSPLKSAGGRREGLTLLFNDESARKQLEQQVKIVTEERRAIKDMFASYLSEDIVQMLMDRPELVKPGGGQRQATVFFADIAGYTSFSEGRAPEYVVQVLNEFFEEAEPIVRRHKGYLDKYIGDCIMAVFGVPLDTGRDDTIRAVSCAVELQQLVNDPSRRFFRGDADRLKIQVGMHSGPLVAGNIGGSRRMDFTEIGDTVNVAARLEGIARPGEIIISDQTKNQLDDRFRVEQREVVRVKGKAEPIAVYNVLGYA